MLKRTVLLVCLVFLVCAVPQAGQSCSSFFLDHGNSGVFGKNFDWFIGDGLVIVNKRNVSKEAVIPRYPGQPAATWTSRYGSVTFNQCGREWPFGGMNEAGLVIEMMMHPEARYPEPDSRKAIAMTPWIQYQLDNFASVEEVIASDSKIRIMSPEKRFPIHYLVCDKKGDCVSMEFIDGKLVYHTKETMPVKVLTNSTYADCINYWKQGRIPENDPYASFYRFNHAADMVKNYHPETTPSACDYAFKVLADPDVRQSHTLWSIVYDIDKSRIYFKTDATPNIRYMDLTSFDFSCSTPVKILDMNAALSGDVTEDFVAYSKAMNRHLLEKINTFYQMPLDILGKIAQTPERSLCTE
jgi:choloylglycine hydrolase